MNVVEIIHELQNRVLEYKEENMRLKMKNEELQKEIDRLKKTKKPYVTPTAKIVVDENEGTITIPEKKEDRMDFFIPSSTANSDVEEVIEKKPKRSRRKKNVE